jgi:ATP-dependent Lon protease
MDIDDIPEHLRRRLDFHFVRDVEEVLGVALERPRRAGKAAA